MFMLTSFLFVFALFTQGQDQKPNFTGVWKADDNQSIGRVPEEFETIEHKDPECTIAIRFRQSDLMRPPESYVIDGKVRTIGKSTVSARWEGSTLVIDSNTPLQNGASVSHDLLSLSYDGETLTKKSQSNWTGRMETNTTVFERISSTAKRNHFEIGSTMQEVKNAWGKPNEVVGTDPNQIYYYFNWLCGMSRACRRQVTFVNGKVSEIR